MIQLNDLMDLEVLLADGGSARFGARIACDPLRTAKEIGLTLDANGMASSARTTSADMGTRGIFVPPVQASTIPTFQHTTLLPARHLPRSDQS